MLKYHRTSLPEVGDVVEKINFTVNGEYANIKFASGKLVGIRIQKDYTNEEIKTMIVQHVKNNEPVTSNELKKLMEPCEIPEKNWRSQLQFLVDNGMLYHDEGSKLNFNRRRHSRRK